MPTPVNDRLPISIIAQVMGSRCASPPHLAHVLFVMQRVNHRARAQEQQRLEEGMRKEMEHGRAIGRDAGGHEHVAEL